MKIEGSHDKSLWPTLNENVSQNKPNLMITTMNEYTKNILLKI